MRNFHEELGPLQSAVHAALDRLAAADAVPRLWRHEGTLWSADATTARAIEGRLGWLRTPDEVETFLHPIEEYRTRLGAVRRVVLLGMGGSSLAPEVMGQTLPQTGPPLTVLDSTSPEAIRAAEEAGLARALFVVSSKSGTTTETRTLAAYFRERAGREAGAVFVAVTDPDTPLARQAAGPPFDRVFLNPADIGGRYSALSFFGLVPAALAGVDARTVMERAAPMVEACRAEDPAQNPGARLGAVLGAAAAAGRDKVTLVTTPTLGGLGAWIEQLLAESTGKQGRGLLPVDAEPLGEPNVYGPDRLFIRIALAGEIDVATEAHLAALAHAGHPLVRIVVLDPLDLGAEFFRWEVATALAGFLLEINPFDEPNVQQSKDLTNAFLDDYVRDGRLPDENPVVRGNGIQAFGPVGGHGIGDALSAFLRPIRPPQYAALLAYLPRTREYDASVQAIRRIIRDRLHVATTRGFGPRYLHSTGQLFKGGPPTGVFLVVTADARPDLSIPGEPYSFGTLLAAQGRGDVHALRSGGRPVVRLHLSEPLRDLAFIARALETGLTG